MVSHCMGSSAVTGLDEAAQSTTSQVSLASNVLSKALQRLTGIAVHRAASARAGSVARKNREGNA